MRTRTTLLLLLAMLVWGFNFVPTHFALEQLSPFTFSALRFVITAFPAIFFVKRPDVPWRRLVAYGLFLFAGQFTLFYLAMWAGLSAGLTAMVLQMQAFFTIGLAALLLKERPRSYQVGGALVAMGGIGVVAAHTGGDATPLSVGLALGAAFSWACGNLISKSFGKADMFAVMIWGNFFASVAMLALALGIDGPTVMYATLTQLSWRSIISILYVVYASSFIGYTIWGRALSNHPAASVVPFTLLVPAIAMLSASLVLGESYPMWKFEATVLILCGLALNQFGGRVIGMIKRPKPAPATD